MAVGHVQVGRQKSDTLCISRCWAHAHQGPMCRAGFLHLCGMDILAWILLCFGAHPCLVGCLAAPRVFHPLDASSNPLPSFDTQKCLQMLPKRPQKAKSTLVQDGRLGNQRLKWTQTGSEPWCSPGNAGILGKLRCVGAGEVNDGEVDPLAREKSLTGKNKRLQLK